jgi:hypothetical protein
MFGNGWTLETQHDAFVPSGPFDGKRLATPEEIAAVRQQHAPPPAPFNTSPPADEAFLR